MSALLLQTARLIAYHGGWRGLLALLALLLADLI